MKRYTSKIIYVLVIAALLLSGCSGESGAVSVQSLAESDEEIASSIENGAEEVGCTVDIDGNVITYSFDISSIGSVTEDLIKDPEFVKTLETSIASQQEYFSDFCRSLEEKTGIEDITVNVIYTYDNKTVAESSFTSQSDK